MANYNLEDLVTLQGIKLLSQRVDGRLDALEGDTTALRAVTSDGNSIKFYNTTDTTKAAVYKVDFPEEIFLDQAGTTLVNNFEYSAATYPNSTNPNLDGKTVLVLAVKGDKATNPTTKYSFVDMEKLIDIYTASDTSVTVTNDYKIKTNISAAANNAIALKSDGLHVDISGKVDKVSGATTGNIATFASDGSVVDSNHSIATTEQVTALLNEIFPTA